MAKTMQARYPGRCASRCGRDIEVGDTIVYDGRARHADCGTSTTGTVTVDRESAITSAIALVDRAASAGNSLALICDGIREDETLSDASQEALCAYAEWAVAQAALERGREQALANGACGGNLAEEALVYSEAAYDARRAALATA